MPKWHGSTGCSARRRSDGADGRPRAADRHHADLAVGPLTVHTLDVTKLLVGILKGLIVGGAVGYGAYALAQKTGSPLLANPWLVYGAIGAIVGLIVGRPIWSLIRDSDQTSWMGVIKAAFGFGIGCGLYALISKVWHPGALAIGPFENVFVHPAWVGGAIGAVYGGFVELDDATGDPPASTKGKSILVSKESARSSKK